MEALQHLKPTLKELHIIVEDMMGYFGSRDDTYPIGSFSDFDHLKTLSVPAPVLLDDRTKVPRKVVSIDCLPSSLESLTLLDFGPAFKSRSANLFRKNKSERQILNI